MMRKQTILYLAAAVFLVAPLIALSQDGGPESKSERGPGPART